MGELLCNLHGTVLTWEPWITASTDGCNAHNIGLQRETLVKIFRTSRFPSCLEL